MTFFLPIVSSRNPRRARIRGRRASAANHGAKRSLEAAVGTEPSCTPGFNQCSTLPGVFAEGVDLVHASSIEPAHAVSMRIDMDLSGQQGMVCYVPNSSHVAPLDKYDGQLPE